MNRSRCCLLSALVLCCGLAAPATAQTIAKKFTYQGFMERNGQPYTGLCNFDVFLYNTLTGGTSRDRAVVNNNVPVTDGVFSIVLDFGDTDTSGQPVYNGTPMYLEIRADTPSDPQVILSPRQLIQPAPYAVTALGLPGINTTNGTLDVTGGAISKGTGTVATGDLGLYTLNSGNWMRLVTNNAPIQFFTNMTAGAAASPVANSTAMTIAASGAVGIGTSSPATKFHIVDTSFPTMRTQSSSAIGTWAQFQNTSTGGHNWTLISTGSANGEGPGKFIISDQNVGGSRMTIDTSGNVGIGNDSPAEKLHVNGNVRARVVIIEGADLAEKFDIAPADGLTPIPGMVVTIDREKAGRLRVASNEYDRTVAGVISGAGGVRPGVVLAQPGTLADGEFPIASVGRVWCYVDADAGGAVEPGDMLTTSSTPGHAMKAVDSTRAGGAVLGKAMSSLPRGRGLVLILVNLQ